MPAAALDLTDRKTVLFCPECGHVGHPDGEWAVSVGEDRRRYRCPDCGTTVADQPRF